MKEQKKPTVLKYKLKLVVDNKQIGLKPHILNVLGNICFALISDLNDISEEELHEQITFTIDPNSTTEDRVQLDIATKSIPINAYIQQMIWKPIAGMLNTLNGLPEKFEEILRLPISIQLQKKKLS